METKLKVGDKVWFESVRAGKIKAVIVYIAKDGLFDWEIERITLKVTSRKNPIYPLGTSFLANPMHIYWRK